jgi:hypothetical protein
MTFAFIARELRKDDLTMLETHRDEFIDFLPRSYSRAYLRTSSRALSHFSHGPNHRSYGFSSRENIFVSRRFRYDRHPHRGDRFPRRPDFPVGESYTHFEPRHLDGPHFLHRDSHPTGSKTKVVTEPPQK